MPADARASETAEKERHEREQEPLAADRVGHQIRGRRRAQDRLLRVVASRGTRLTSATSAPGRAVWNHQPGAPTTAALHHGRDVW